MTEAAAMEGQHVYVVGAGNSAGQAALHLAKYANRVTMIVRGDALGKSMSDYLVKTIEATANIAVRLRTTVLGGHGTGRLEGIDLLNHDSGEMLSADTAALFVLIGAQPHTDWLPSGIQRDAHGFILTDEDLTAPSPAFQQESRRRPLLLETSLPGVFAAGDVRHGSIKRVASAVGEGGISIRSVHQHLAQLSSPT